jgi:hypothetical protein
MSLELRSTDVILRYGFDVWATGMTLLAVADLNHSLGGSNGLDEDPDPRLYEVSYQSDPADVGQLMEVRNPRLDEVLSFLLTAKFYGILDIVFQVEAKRLTAEEVVELVVALEAQQEY